MNSVHVHVVVVSVHTMYMYMSVLSVLFRILALSSLLLITLVIMTTLMPVTWM